MVFSTFSREFENIIRFLLCSLEQKERERERKEKMDVGGGGRGGRVLLSRLHLRDVLTNVSANFFLKTAYS